MRINEIRQHAQNAYNGYVYADRNKPRSTDTFVNEMDEFYSKGMERPNIAKLVMWSDVIRPSVKKEQQKLDETHPKDFSMVNLNPLVQIAEEMRYNVLVQMAMLLERVKLFDSIFIMENTTPKNKESFDKKYNELYPKTGKIRDKILQYGRVNTDGVQNKTPWNTKVTIAAETMDLLKKYPKTDKLRVSLFLRGRLKEDKVTPKLKFWQKFRYAKFFK